MAPSLVWYATTLQNDPVCSNTKHVHPGFCYMMTKTVFTNSPLKNCTARKPYSDRTVLLPFVVCNGIITAVRSDSTLVRYSMMTNVGTFC